MPSVLYFNYNDAHFHTFSILVCVFGGEAPPVNHCSAKQFWLVESLSKRVNFSLISYFISHVTIYNPRTSTTRVMYYHWFVESRDHPQPLSIFLFITKLKTHIVALNTWQAVINLIDCHVLLLCDDCWRPGSKPYIRRIVIDKVVYSNHEYRSLFAL